MKVQRLHILIVDDDPGDAEMARAILGQIDHPHTTYEVEWVSSYQEALAHLDAPRHDLFLVDYFLEDRDGLELVREARRRGVRRPIIMLTGRGSHEVDLQAMRAGASDYLVKGSIDPDLMERSIRYALDRSRAEAALRESEERHRSMFDHLPVGLYRVSPEGDFIDANPALVRMLGYPDPATLQERYARSLYVAPGDADELKRSLEKTGVVRSFRSTLGRADGSHVRVRNTARSHRGRDGRLLYYEGVVEDVDAGPADSDGPVPGHAFETLLRHSPVPTLVVDAEGVLRAANAAVERALGHEPETLVGASVDTLCAAGEGISDALDRLLSGSEDDVRLERRLHTPDGALVWARVHACGVRDARGVPDHVLIVLEDVAEA